MKTIGDKIQEIVKEIQKSDPMFHEFIASQVLLSICGCESTDQRPVFMVQIDGEPASSVYHSHLAQVKNEKENLK